MTAPFQPGDRVEIWVWMANVENFADVALIAGVVTKVGKKKIQVQWESHDEGDLKWIYPHKVERRNWLTLQEERTQV